VAQVWLTGVKIVFIGKRKTTRHEIHPRRVRVSGGNCPLLNPCGSNLASLREMLRDVDTSRRSALRLLLAQSAVLGPPNLPTPRSSSHGRYLMMMSLIRELAPGVLGFGDLYLSKSHYRTQTRQPEMHRCILLPGPRARPTVTRSPSLRSPTCPARSCVPKFGGPGYGVPADSVTVSRWVETQTQAASELEAARGHG
jgi:hypothetical protein